MPFKLALIYDDDKRYIIPFSIIEKYVDKSIIKKIKIEALKEIQKA